MKIKKQLQAAKENNKDINVIYRDRTGEANSLNGKIRELEEDYFTFRINGHMMLNIRYIDVVAIGDVIKSK